MVSKSLEGSRTGTSAGNSKSITQGSGSGHDGQHQLCLCSLEHLKTFFPVASPVMRGLGGGDFLEEMYYQVPVLKLKSQTSSCSLSVLPAYRGRCVFLASNSGNHSCLMSYLPSRWSLSPLDCVPKQTFPSRSCSGHGVLLQQQKGTDTLEQKFHPLSSTFPSASPLGKHHSQQCAG